MEGFRQLDNGLSRTVFFSLVHVFTEQCLLKELSFIKIHESRFFERRNSHFLEENDYVITLVAEILTFEVKENEDYGHNFTLERLNHDDAILRSVIRENSRVKIGASPMNFVVSNYEVELKLFPYMEGDVVTMNYQFLITLMGKIVRLQE